MHLPKQKGWALAEVISRFFRRDSMAIRNTPLLTCTIIFVKPSTYTHYQDYVVGISQMKEGVRVLAWLKIDDPKKIRPKMKVQLTTVKREPEGFLTYQFIPR